MLSLIPGSHLAISVVSTLSFHPEYHSMSCFLGNTRGDLFYANMGSQRSNRCSILEIDQAVWLDRVMYPGQGFGWGSCCLCTNNMRIVGTEFGL